jgi:uncharacterized protein with GYD domain
MPTYVRLSNFTEQGMKNIKDTAKRAEAFKKAAKEAGITIKELLWTQGQYDVVISLKHRTKSPPVHWH